MGADPRAGTQLAGYRIEALLGRGGMADVYRAEDLRLGRKVALKLLAPDLAGDERFRERFLRESRLAASLDHPNVIPVYEAGEAEGLLFIAMRYVEGTDLRRIVEQEAPLEPRRALALLGPVADALDAAHARGLVHRDVKPGNVLIAADPPGHVYLSDFGLTKQAGSDARLTETGQFVGTADYAAPEQIAKGPIDARTDEYALACVLYECLTGETPFHAESLMAVLWGHVSDPPPSASTRNPALGKEIDAVLAAGMAKKPQERYASCRELIDGATQGLGITGEIAVPALVAPTLTRKRLLVATGGALLVAAAAAVPAIVLTRDRERTAPLAIEPGSLVGVDAATNEPIVAVSIGGLSSRNPLAVGKGAVWAASLPDETVLRIDPATGAVTRTVGISGAPLDLAVGEDTVWLVSSLQFEGKLTEIDPSTGQVSRAHSLGEWDPAQVAAGSGAVWVTARGPRGNAVLRVLPSTGEVAGVIPLPEPADNPTDSPPGAIAAGEGAVWAGYTPSARLIWRIDPATDKVVATIEVSEQWDIATGEGAVWVAQGFERSLARLDPETNEITRIDVGRPAGGVAVGQGSVWVHTHDTLTRVDPRTNQVVAEIDLAAGREDVPISLGPGQVAAGPEGVWVEVLG